MSTKKFYTDYETAAHWGCNRLILCNNIAEVDESVYDNMDIQDDHRPEIYQWYLCSASSDNIKYLKNTFDLIFSYSEMLDLYVLCVDHFGTGWDSIPCRVKRKEWIECNQNLLF